MGSVCMCVHVCDVCWKSGHGQGQGQAPLHASRASMGSVYVCVHVCDVCWKSGHGQGQAPLHASRASMGTVGAPGDAHTRSRDIL